MDFAYIPQHRLRVWLASVLPGLRFARRLSVRQQRCQCVCLLRLRHHRATAWRRDEQTTHDQRQSNGLATFPHWSLAGGRSLGKRFLVPRIGTGCCSDRQRLSFCPFVSLSLSGACRPAACCGAPQLRNAGCGPVDAGRVASFYNTCTPGGNVTKPPRSHANQAYSMLSVRPSLVKQGRLDSTNTWLGGFACQNALRFWLPRKLRRNR